MPLAARRLVSLFALGVAACGVESRFVQEVSLRRLSVVDAGVGAEVVAPVGRTGRRFLALASVEGALRLFDAEDPERPRLLWRAEIAGGEPTSVAARADLSEIYVAVKRAGARDAFGFIVVLTGGDRGAPTVDRTYVVGVGPDCLALAPDEKTLVAAIEDEDTPWRAGEVALVDVRREATAAAVRRVDLGTFDAEPEYVVVAADGRFAYVGLQEQSELVAIDLRAAAVVGRLALAPGAEPDGVALTPSGRFLVAANEEAQTLDVVEVGPEPGALRPRATLDLRAACRRSPPSAATTDRTRRDDDEQGRGRRPATARLDPEGVACVDYDGAPYAVVGLEKAGRLVAVSLRDPGAPRLAAVAESGRGVGAKPEVVTRLRDGETIVVANEGEGTVALFRLGPRDAGSGSTTPANR